MSWSDPCGASPSRDERACRSGTARFVVALTLSAGLAGCGFQLRGEANYPFQTIYVNAVPSQPISVELKRALEGSGSARLADSPADAQVTLEISRVVDDKGVLSLTSGGRVREYSLVKRVFFRVQDATGKDWLPPSEITIARSYSFSESEVLARAAQEQRLLKEMQTDAVQQIVRRLQAAKKPA